ncbi:hypothetical protein HQ520_01880 [bacterium]|nr:hypothetical protein [bacterium]
MPLSLKGIIQSRIDLLDHRRKLVLQCGAVLGQRFTVELTELFDVMRGGLLARLYSLKGLDFLEETRSLGEIEFLFRHHLVRETAYQSLLERQRKIFHQLIGEQMEEVFAARIEDLYPVLAYHSEKSNDEARGGATSGSGRLGLKSRAFLTIP